MQVGYTLPNGRTVVLLCEVLVRGEYPVAILKYPHGLRLWEWVGADVYPVGEIERYVTEALGRPLHFDTRLSEGEDATGGYELWRFTAS